VKYFYGKLYTQVIFLTKISCTCCIKNRNLAIGPRNYQKEKQSHMKGYYCNFSGLLPVNN